MSNSSLWSRSFYRVVIVFLVIAVVFIGHQGFRIHQRSSVRPATSEDYFSQPSAAPGSEGSHKEHNQTEWNLPEEGKTAPTTTYSIPINAATDAFASPTGGISHHVEEDECSQFPDTSDVLLVIKTGATETFEKLPTQLLTAHRCVRDYVVFSDMDHWIGDVHVHDILSDFPESATRDNPDFDHYRKLKKYGTMSPDTSTLKSLGDGKAGWNLDKYKNIPGTERAYRMYPDKKWYFFVDTDTYVFWHNVMQWLDRLDSTEALYLGSPSYIGGTQFAHGGSGYLLSQAAMKKFLGPAPTGGYTVGEKTRKMLKDTDFQGQCCGDVILAEALAAIGLELSRFWPMINNERPNGIPFGPSHWCQPILTMHHVLPETVNNIWLIEQNRSNRSELILIEELYRLVLEPYVGEDKEDWYNNSEDVYLYPPDSKEDYRRPNKNEMTKLKKNAWRSFDDCQAACEEHDDCFQFVFATDQCQFANSFKLGTAKPSEENRSWKSGWLKHKFQKFVDKHTPCKGPEWVEAGPRKGVDVPLDDER